MRLVYIGYGYYVSDRDAARLARNAGSPLPAMGHKLFVDLPTGQRAWLSRTRRVYGTYAGVPNPKRGWVWMVQSSEDLSGIARAASATRRRSSRTARDPRRSERAEMIALLERHRYSHPRQYAATLAAEGIGPHELRERLRIPHGVGSLAHTHGFRRTVDSDPSPSRRDRLTRAARRRLPSRAFALSKRRALPIEDASHVRNAAARLEQMRRRGSITPAEYRTAKAKILRAEKRRRIGRWRKRRS